jgi:hypothetical protein
LNVTDVLAKIVRLTELRCRETAAWLRHHCTLSTVVRTRPKRDNSSTDQVSAKLDRNLLNVDPDTTLQALAGSVDEKRQAIVCLDSAGRPSAAFTVFDVLRFISERAKALDGMVDLKDHKVSDLLGTFSHAERWVAMDEKTSMGLAVKEFQKPRIQILVGTVPRRERRPVRSCVLTGGIESTGTGRKTKVEFAAAGELPREASAGSSGLKLPNIDRALRLRSPRHQYRLQDRKSGARPRPRTF